VKLYCKQPERPKGLPYGVYNLVFMVKRDVNISDLLTVLYRISVEFVVHDRT